MSAEEIRRVFDLFDANKDGVLSSNELKGLMITLGYHVSDEELSAIMADLDTNHNGVIDFEEFGRLSITHPPKPSEKHTVEDYTTIFSLFDHDGNGVITSAELKATMATMTGADVTDEQVEQAMKEADTNGDGVINYAEFARVMANH